MKSQKKSRVAAIVAILILIAAVGAARAQNIVKSGSFDKPPCWTPKELPNNAIELAYSRPYFWGVSSQDILLDKHLFSFYITKAK